MPDGLDYGSDQDFLGAPPEQQHAYLNSVDKDYAAAPPERQKAYIASLGGTMTEKQAAARPPTAPMPNVAVKPVKNIVGGPKDETLEQGLAREKPLGAPLMPAGAGLISAPRMAGSVIGSMAGGEGGNYLAHKLGLSENATRWMSDAMGIAGGALGAGGAGKLENFSRNVSLETPEKVNLPGGFKLKYTGQQPSEGTGAPLPSSAEYYEQKAADLMRRGREQGALDRSAARNAAVPDPVAEAVKNRTANWMPTKVGPPAPPQDALAVAVKNRTANYLPTKVAPPKEEALATDPVAEAVSQRIANWMPTKLKPPAATPAEPEPTDPTALAVRARIANWLPTKIKHASEESGGTTSLARRSGLITPDGQDLITRTRKLTVPGEEPNEMDLKRAGDLTQSPVARLKLLAHWGDKLAQNELNRRLKN